MTAPKQVPPGAMFFLPGYTQWTEQDDNNANVVTVLSQQNSVNATGFQAFNQTDVVFWWELELTITNTVTPGTSAVTTSPYWPYNFLGESKLRIQNMYDTWHPLSGIDAAIWQIIRPVRGLLDSRNNLGANPAGSINSNAGWANTSMPAANLDAQAGATSATASLIFTLQIPVSIQFDMYFDLGKDGSILSPGHRAIVSPQYMAGSARQVIPAIQYFAGSTGNLNTSPYNIGAGTGTFTGQVSHKFKRIGLYGENNPATMPPVYNWQYMQEAKEYTLAGRSQMDILVPAYGQILSLFVRLWDPSANGGLGAPISLANVTKCELRYGSNLQRFQDTPRSAQRRFRAQHGVIPPQGVIIWDLAVDNNGRVTNAMALNTLTTASVLVHLEFTGAQSATAIAVLGTEALTFVE